MNRSDLQLNLYDLISCSCWDAVVLHVGMQLFLGESNQSRLSSPPYTFTKLKIDAFLRCRLGQP